MNYSGSLEGVYQKFSVIKSSYVIKGSDSTSIDEWRNIFCVELVVDTMVLSKVCVLYFIYSVVLINDVN